MNYEYFSICLFPKEGKCSKSCFANGNHRVGIVPTESVLDGGVCGDSAREICVECGKWFKKSWFVIKNQPRKIGGR